MVIVNETDKTIVRISHALVETDTECEAAKTQLANANGMLQAMTEKVSDLQVRLVEADKIIADKEAIIASMEKRVYEDADTAAIATNI